MSHRIITLRGLMAAMAEVDRLRRMRSQCAMNADGLATLKPEEAAKYEVRVQHCDLRLNELLDSEIGRDVTAT
jgi:hypothetical protein